MRVGFRTASSPTFHNICAEADEHLFSKVASNSRHQLHALLPPPRDNHYDLIESTHNFTLPTRSSALLDYNFITGMLYKNLNYSIYMVRATDRMCYVYSIITTYSKSHDYSCILISVVSSNFVCTYFVCVASKLISVLSDSH